MLAGEQAGCEEEHFTEEARTIEDRVHIPIGTAMHLAVKHPKWTGGVSRRNDICVYTVDTEKDGQ